MLHGVPPQRAYRITGETDVDSPWHWTGGHRPVRTMSSALSSQEGEATASRRPLGLAPPSAPLAGLVIASGHHQFSSAFYIGVDFLLLERQGSGQRAQALRWHYRHLVLLYHLPIVWPWYKVTETLQV